MRAIRFATACAVAWSLQAGVAFAMEDWLDRLSGPGRFHGVFISYRFLCMTNTSDQANFGTLAGVPRDTERAETVLTFIKPWDRTVFPFRPIPAAVPVPSGVVQPAALHTYRRQQAAHDCLEDQRLRGYFAVAINRYWSYQNHLVVEPEKRAVHIDGLDFSYVHRLNRAVEVSGMVSVNRLVSATKDGVEPGFRTLTNRWAVTPSLLLSPFAVASDGPRVRWLKISVGAMMFFDQFVATDFCNQGRGATCTDPTWRSSRKGKFNEFIPHIGIVIDLSVASRRMLQ